MGVSSLRSSISISIVLHGLFLALCAFVLTRSPAPFAPRNLNWVELATSPRARTAPADPAKAKDTRVRQKIVQTEHAEAVNEAPADAFLGERNQRVDRQTVSRQKMIVMGSQAQMAAGAPPVARPTPATQARDLSKLEAFKGLGVPIFPAVQPREGSRLSDEANRRWAEASPEGQAPQDYIEGLAESERTALSTQEFVYFGYYQRIRERLDRAWVPILRQNLMAFYRSGRRLASEIDHSTRVLVVLNPQGEIIQVKLVSESGTRDLDDAAIKAFNRAGPFPNPPRGIIGRDNQVQIPWEFVLKT